MGERRESVVPRSPTLTVSEGVSILDDSILCLSDRRRHVLPRSEMTTATSDTIMTAASVMPPPDAEAVEAYVYGDGIAYD